MAAATLARKENLSEMAMLHRTVGSLTTANGFLEKQIDELRAKECALIQEVEMSKSEVSTQKAEIEKLQKQFVELVNADHLTIKYLRNELTEVKLQKAEIRCDNMELKRKLARYEQSFGKLHDTLPMDMSPVAKEKPEVAVSSPVCADCPTLRAEITNLQRQLTENTEKSRAVKEQSDAELCDLREQIAAQTAVNKKLQDELLANTEKVAEMVKAKRIVEERWKRFMEELREMRTDCEEKIATLVPSLNENKEREAGTESERVAAKSQFSMSKADKLRKTASRSTLISSDVSVLKKTSTSSLKRKTSASSVFNQSTEREKRTKC